MSSAMQEWLQEWLRRLFKYPKLRPGLNSRAAPRLNSRGGLCQQLGVDVVTLHLSLCWRYRGPAAWAVIPARRGRGGAVLHRPCRMGCAAHQQSAATLQPACRLAASLRSLLICLGWAWHQAAAPARLQQHTAAPGRPRPHRRPVKPPRLWLQEPAAPPPCRWPSQPPLRLPPPPAAPAGGGKQHGCWLRAFKKGLGVLLCDTVPGPLTAPPASIPLLHTHPQTTSQPLAQPPTSCTNEWFPPLSRPQPKPPTSCTKSVRQILMVPSSLPEA